MEAYLKNLQSHSNVYHSDQTGFLHDTAEQYPLINFGGNNPMLEECLPNEEQLCNFISSLDGSTSLTFEKLLQSSRQDNNSWCNNYNASPLRPPAYSFSVPGSHENINFHHTPSRPRMIRGCQDYPVDRWNSSLNQGSYYAQISEATDLNNNNMPCLNRNFDRNVYGPKKFGCMERQCQDYASNQGYPAEKVECDWNNNGVMADLNNNACAVPEKSNETHELKIVSLLYHTKSLQTLAGKFHVLLDLSLKQLKLLSDERHEIERSIFSEVAPTSSSYQRDHSSRIERLISGYLNEVKPVRKICLKLDVVNDEKLKTDNRQLIDSWIGCLESIQLSRQSSSNQPQKEYLTQQACNLKTLNDQTRRVRTCLWCVRALTTDTIA